MSATFQDLENESNPRNGAVLHDREGARTLFDELFRIQPPYMCQFSGVSGSNLAVGIGRDVGCVQCAPSDGLPPYLMAVEKDSESRRLAPDMIFSVGGTATAIDGRYRLSLDRVKEIVAEFVATGSRSALVDWKELK